MTIACICVGSLFVTACLLPPPAAMPGKQGAGGPPPARSAESRESIEVAAAGFLGTAHGPDSDADTQPAPIELGSSVMSVTILGQEQRPSFRFEPTGTDIRCLETREPGVAVVGRIEWSGSQVLWTWAEHGPVMGPEAARALESAICGLGLLAMTSDGRERRISFVEQGLPEHPARAEPERGPDSMQDPAEAASAVIPRAPFQPQPDPLGDVSASTDLLFRSSSQLKSIRVVLPEPESGLDFAQESPTTVVVRCKDASGAAVELGRFEASGMEVRWKWRRVDAGKCGRCLCELQDLAEAMTLEVDGVNGTRSLACLEPMDERLEGVVTDLPSGAASGKLSSEDRIVLRAIRLAEERFSEEAASWTRAQARAIQEQRDAARRASDSSRKARNAQQRHEEKNGWWDRNGVWHAPDGHGSRSQDDRIDGVRKARPGGGVSGGIRLRGAWGAKMASEVDAEQARDSSAGKDPERLASEASDIDSPQIRKFVDKWIGNITDSRIREMLKLVRQELARLRSSAGSGP